MNVKIVFLALVLVTLVLAGCTQQTQPPVGGTGGTAGGAVPISNAELSQVDNLANQADSLADGLDATVLPPSTLPQ